jgi:hypothetical protein
MEKVVLVASRKPLVALAIRSTPCPFVSAPG